MIKYRIVKVCVQRYGDDTNYELEPFYKVEKRVLGFLWWRNMFKYNLDYPDYFSDLSEARQALRHQIPAKYIDKEVVETYSD